MVSYQLQMYRRYNPLKIDVVTGNLVDNMILVETECDKLINCMLLLNLQLA